MPLVRCVLCPVSLVCCFVLGERHATTLLAFVRPRRLRWGVPPAAESTVLSALTSACARFYHRGPQQMPPDARTAALASGGEMPCCARCWLPVCHVLATFAAAGFALDPSSAPLNAVAWSFLWPRPRGDRGDGGGGRGRLAGAARAVRAEPAARWLGHARARQLGRPFGAVSAFRPLLGLRPALSAVLCSPACWVRAHLTRAVLIGAHTVARVPRGSRHRSQLRVLVHSRAFRCARRRVLCARGCCRPVKSWLAAALVSADGWRVLRSAPSSPPSLLRCP